jgi:MFS family permease
LPFGKLYANFDIKWMFLSALAIFEIGSILCAAAPNSDCLIVGRAVAGLGATGIATGALLVSYSHLDTLSVRLMGKFFEQIISHSMPVSQRQRYTAMIGAAMGVTLVIAPFLGGVFTDKLNWSMYFAHKREYCDAPELIALLQDGASG